MKNKIRTEEEILKDFEKLGWIVVDRYSYFMLKKIEKEQEWLFEIEHNCYICIDKEKHTYGAYGASDLHSCIKDDYQLSMQEHKLLHELFICYGWL